jgi:hypothetical protein
MKLAMCLPEGKREGSPMKACGAVAESRPMPGTERRRAMRGDEEAELAQQAPQGVDRADAIGQPARAQTMQRGDDLDADWSADLSLLMPDAEAPALAELFSDSPREARRAFKELCELGDVDPDAPDFRQEWLPPAAGLATVDWLLHEAAQPRSKVQRLLGTPATAKRWNTVILT